MAGSIETIVTVTESGDGPYAQFVRAGRHRLLADEPIALGGHDTGPSPYEYVLAGLGACTTMTLRMYADRHGWKLDRLTATLRHEKIPASDGIHKIDRFERVIDIVGDITDAQRLRLLEIADKCPVSQTLLRPSIIDTRLTPVVPPQPNPAADAMS